MTSIPASRNARATTFAPRSWPSNPGFAIRTRIFFAIGITSVEERLLPNAEGLPHHVDDFAQGRLRPHRVEDEGHRVRLTFATLPELIERPVVLLRVPGPSDASETFHLGFQGRFAHAQRFEFRLFVDHEVIHADDHRSEEHTSELQSPCNLVC